MWGYPYLTYVAIGGMIAILVAMAFIPDQRLPLLFGSLSLGILIVGFLAKERAKGNSKPLS
jgi:GABA permease